MGRWRAFLWIASILVFVSCSPVEPDPSKSGPSLTTVSPRPGTSGTGLRGRLLVRVVDQAGRPLPAAANPHCTPMPVDPSVQFNPGVATGTDATGTCVFDPIPAAAFDVEVSFIDSHDITKTVHGRVVVPADGTGAVTIAIDR